MSSSTWRVLSGYATYQRTPMRMTSGGKCAPLKLIAIVASLMMHGCSERTMIPQNASNKNCDRTRGRPSPACHAQPCDASVASPLPLLAQEVLQLVHELFRVKVVLTPRAWRLITRCVIVLL